MNEKKKAQVISQDEIERQNLIIDRIRRSNEGKNPLACVITFGCKQNENDSEKICGMLEEMGYGFTDEKEKADLIIYNTCAVRENAENKVFGNLGTIKPLKDKKKDLIIGVCGCMTQQQHIVDRIKAKYKQVDLVFGTHSLYKFPELLEAALSHREMVIDAENSSGVISEGIPVRRTEKARACVSIMYGCNNFCSYCIVPYVRGRERSRMPEDIIGEITALAAEGCKEITLLGQNVNSYGHDLGLGVDFADLLSEVSKIKGIEWIRFATSHPKDISDKLIDTMASHENICKQLHIPVQAGSNRVLELMNRKYTREKYLEIIDKVRSKMPDITLTTDIIVGFPGETNEDFEKTLDLLKTVEFDNIFSFIYSKRKGTPAEKMPDCLSEEEKKANFEKMIKLQSGISLKKNKQMVGKICKVLVEGESKTNKAVFSSRTEGGKIVLFKAEDNMEGNFVNMRITHANTWTLYGEIVK